MPPNHQGIFPSSFLPFLLSSLPHSFLHLRQVLPPKSHLKAAMSTAAWGAPRWGTQTSPVCLPPPPLCFIPSLIHVVCGTQSEMSLACRIKFRLLMWGESQHLTHQNFREDLAQVTKAIERWVSHGTQLSWYVWAGERGPQMENGQDAHLPTFALVPWGHLQLNE